MGTARQIGALLLLSACADPTLDPLGEALRSWEAGLTRWEAGDHRGAREAFAHARALDPGSPALCAWDARATAEIDGPDAALQVLDACVRGAPADPALRLDRAQLLARTGQIERAGAELVVVLESGLHTPESLAALPDLAALVDHPALPGLVRSPAPRWAARPTTPSALVGDRWDVQLDGEGPSGPLRLDLGAGEGLAVVGLIEDLGGEAQGRRPRGLIIRGRVSAAGAALVGPLRIQHGEAQPVAVGPLRLERVALGAPPPEVGLPWSGELPTPSALAAAVSAGAVARVGGWTVVGGPAGEPPHFTGAAPSHATVELREGGQPVWTGVVLPAGASATVTVRGADGQRQTLQVGGG
jgi:hypothetical protein